ncbi:MAG: XapX domain-containing protein [Rhodanobacter sp. SCN 65-17]|nr:MAG: XapX domain-containing protein [Rhodanobacter sp. SCN 65-17]
MKPYLLSLAVGVLVGVIYALLRVKSPAPPTIALIGLLGILIGEQIVPVAARLFRGEPVASFIRHECTREILRGPAAPSREPKDLS